MMQRGVRPCGSDPRSDHARYGAIVKKLGLKLD